MKTWELTLIRCAPRLLIFIAVVNFVVQVLGVALGLAEAGRAGMAGSALQWISVVGGIAGAALQSILLVAAAALLYYLERLVGRFGGN